MSFLRLTTYMQFYVVCVVILLNPLKDPNLFLRRSSALQKLETSIRIAQCLSSPIIVRSSHHTHTSWTRKSFYPWGCLKDKGAWRLPQTISDLKGAIASAIRVVPREKCGKNIEKFAHLIEVSLQRQRAHWSIFWTSNKVKSFCRT